jgi:uncharacterized protein (DUF488 family)
MTAAIVCMTRSRSATESARQQALDRELSTPSPCFMCAETEWRRRHRRLIAELLTARGRRAVHLLRSGRRESHRVYHGYEAHDGRLYFCGALVA